MGASPVLFGANLRPGLFGREARAAGWSPRRCCSTWCSSAKMDASRRRRWCGSSSSCATRCAVTHTPCSSFVVRRSSFALGALRAAFFPQDTSASGIAPSSDSAAAAPVDQRASIEANIERQRREKLAAKQKGGGSSDPRHAWGAASPSPAPAAGMSPGARDASSVARSYCSAVGAQHRDARSVFDAYDTSRSGVITFEDLRRGVRRDPSMSKSGLSDTDVSPSFHLSPWP